MYVLYMYILYGIGDPYTSVAHNLFHAEKRKRKRKEESSFILEELQVGDGGTNRLNLTKSSA